LSTHDTATGAYHLADRFETISTGITSVLGTFLQDGKFFFAFEESSNTHLYTIALATLILRKDYMTSNNNRPKAFVYYPEIEKVFGVGCQTGITMILSFNAGKLLNITSNKYSRYIAPKYIR
jgi:hypothetical protein